MPSDFTKKSMEGTKMESRSNTGLVAPPLSGTIVDIVSREVEMETRKNVELVASKVAIKQAVIRGRALLADSAMSQVASLSALEEHLNRVAPSGANRYKHIADAYAIVAAQLLAR